MKVLKDFYNWSPVVAHALLSGIIVLLFLLIEKLGGPKVDYTWLIGVLGAANVPANWLKVTPSNKVLVKKSGDTSGTAD